MEINFIVLFKDSVESAQKALLNSWRDAIEENRICLIKEATITFESFTFEDYPDQEFLRTELARLNITADSKSTIPGLGRTFETFDELFKNLSESYEIMQMSIKVTDDD